LIAALIYGMLRLAIHGVFLANLLASGEIRGYDLQVYLDAANRLERGQDLYPQGTPDWIEFYQYSPAYALSFVPLLRLPLAAVMIAHSILHVVAYGLLYWTWGRIFGRLGLERARDVLAWTLPIWLVFSQFWADLSYLNVYVFMALFCSLLIDALLDEKLAWSLLWLVLITQTKPQWAFPLALPFLLGRRRTFFKLLAWTIIAYAGIAGLTMAFVGPSFGWAQYVDYGRLLRTISSGNYPWRGPEAPFLGYNHSIVQIVVYWWGISPTTLRLASGIQALLLAPLAVVGAERGVPWLSLDLAFALYLGAFIWLDVVWEVTLGIAAFTYLLSTLDRKQARIYVWVTFLPYALIDLWQVISFLAFGPDVMLPGPYILTDPSIYIPLVMIVILTFYALLIQRSWAATLADQGTRGASWSLRRS
jgi:hypothetical protein